MLLASVDTSTVVAAVVCVGSILGVLQWFASRRNQTVVESNQALVDRVNVLRDELKDEKDRCNDALHERDTRIARLEGRVEELEGTLAERVAEAVTGSLIDKGILHGRD